MIIRDDWKGKIAVGKSALLINPPIWDTQYWAYWSQPHGLLKVARWLREQHGYENLRLLDCLATDQNRRVPFRIKGQVARDDITKTLFEFGWSKTELEQHLREHADGHRFRPDEIWITSIMTYWWETTRLVIRLIEKVFAKPRPRIYVGGIYPTLFPEHANEKLPGEEEVFVVDGEICPEAANSWTDLSLYYTDPLYRHKPRYSIVTGSRGCPFNCAYCAQLRLNHGLRQVRYRPPEDVTDEIEEKQKSYGIREFAFYEDNLLFNREDFLSRLEAIRKRGLKTNIYAPEGIEPRLIERELLTQMRAAGFRKIHLALETIDNDIARGWDRRQATIEKFEQAVNVARDCGFRVGSQDLNAFVLFGMPGEDLQAVVNTALYASHRVGSVVPMLFTPVPGSTLFERHKDYLYSQTTSNGRPWDLQDLNGKFLPFLEYNRQLYSGLRASDYLNLESFMMCLNNSKVHRQRFDFAADTLVSRTFRKLLISETYGCKLGALSANPITK